MVKKLCYTTIKRYNSYKRENMVPVEWYSKIKLNALIINELNFTPSHIMIKKGWRVLYQRERGDI